jgi:hypothetical protein
MHSSAGAFPKRVGCRCCQVLLHLAKQLDPYGEPPGQQSLPEKPPKVLFKFSKIKNISLVVWNFKELVDAFDNVILRTSEFATCSTKNDCD